MKQPSKITLISLLLLFSLGCGLIDRPAPEPVAPPGPAREPLPTFTPTPPLSALAVIPTVTDTPLPTDTPTPPPPTDTPVPLPPTDTPPPAKATSTPTPAPRAGVAQAVNVRSGPGTSYPRIGQVANGHASPILGRNNDASWIFINYPGGQGWIYAGLAQIQGDVNSVAVKQAPAAPPPPPTNTPAPAPPTPVPAGPSYPFKISNAFPETNGAITQIRGHIKDAAGRPLNGIRVRVRSGSFCTVSVASGTAGVYPPGNYDILLDARAKDGNWQVALVDRPTDPQDTSCDPGAQQLSEEISVPTSTTEGVVYVEYQHN